MQTQWWVCDEDSVQRWPAQRQQGRDDAVWQIAKWVLRQCSPGEVQLVPQLQREAPRVLLQQQLTLRKAVAEAVHKRGGAMGPELGLQVAVEEKAVQMAGIVLVEGWNAVRHVCALH